MPRKSPLRLMFTSRWIRWALFRRLFQWAPGLARTFNFPLQASLARDFADEVLVDEEEDLAFAAEDLESAKAVLLPAMSNDHGDTSTYPSGRSRLRSLLLRIHHCTILGHTMSLVDKTGATRLGLYAGPSNWNASKPRLLRQRTAPAGSLFVLTCNGHFYHLFANDIIPLLTFLRRRGPDMGPVHIVTRPDFPPFVHDTLNALCAADKNLRILQLDKTERLVDASALWLSRYAETREWLAVTRAEADELSEILSAYHQLGGPGSADRRLFVSRGGARLRRLKNEEELRPALTKRGFEWFTPRADDHRSQIEAFRSAHIIVTVHGAALTNLLFCRPGTLVVELFPSNHIKSTYCWLAMRLGLRYRPVIGSAGDYLQGFTVDVDEVLAQVENEIENHHSPTPP